MSWLCLWCFIVYYPVIVLRKHIFCISVLFMGFEVPMALNVEVTVYWNVMPCVLPDLVRTSNTYIHMWFNLVQNNSLHFSVGATIAQLIYWEAISWRAGSSYPAGARDFSLLHNFQTGSGAHPVSYPVTSDEAVVPASNRSWIWNIDEIIIGGGYLKFLVKFLPQCHFIHHKSQWITLGFHPVHCDGKPTSKLLSCVTALPGMKYQDLRFSWLWWASCSERQESSVYHFLRMGNRNMHLQT
jgi:hypothetical protein